MYTVTQQYTKINHSWRALLGANNKSSCLVCIGQVLCQEEGVSFHSPLNPVMKPLLSSSFYTWDQKLICTRLVQWLSQNSNLGLLVLV